MADTYSSIPVPVPTQNAVPSADIRDHVFGGAKIDEFVTSLALQYIDRFGKKHYTIEGIKQLAFQAIAAFGYITMDSFEDGATLTLPNQVLRYEASGEYYRWDGEYPKDVSQDSTPENSGGVGVGAWLSVGDATLREKLASSNPPGTNLIGTYGGVNLTQYLARTYIFLDDILPSKDGSSDCSAALNAKMLSLSGAGVTFIGNRSSTYRFDDTVNFTGVSNTRLDFNFATVLDNVQGTIADSGNRGKHTFLCYNNSNVEICRITYNKASTRSNSVDTSIPTHIFWIGGQYLGPAMTRHISIHDVEVNASIFKGCVLGGLGDLDGIDIRRITVNGGDWRFGCNFEYGLQPTDPAVDPSMNNGKHPYNIYVEQFNGSTLLLSDGFLRVASCYNAKFFNCNTFNVKSETYVYSGDRNISRFSQNVTFEACKFKQDGITVTAVNYQTAVLMVNKDGSTGDPLPSWTNYNHSILYKQCEFWNNSTVNSASVRFFGNKGTTTFEGCIFRNSYYGVNAGPSSNPDYVSIYGLTFRDCQFFNNFRDVYTLSTDGILFDHCQFKDQISTSNLSPVFLDSSTLRSVFRACSFTGLKRSTFYVIIQNNNSMNNKFEDCYFEMLTTNDSAISSAAVVYGSGNVSTGMLTPSTATQRGLIGETASRIRDLSVFGGAFAHADVGEYFTSTTSYGLTTIQGGVNGMLITLRGASSGSSVTITHNAVGVDTDKRILLLGNANRTVTGDSWVLRLRKLSNGWWEV
ncbi:tail fiber/spike domain-containing protein [Lelliottia amnigena]|uniref:tail fiber/spike domain-containing protein n=1 Tax=Lelliottia amnigena TaxID=61646 RepID=UPI0040559E31